MRQRHAAGPLAHHASCTGASLRIGASRTQHFGLEALAVDSSVFADWTTCGKVQDAPAHDAEYQTLLTRVRAIAELTGRALLTGIDL
jgi:hypothetical protein